MGEKPAGNKRAAIAMTCALILCGCALNPEMDDGLGHRFGESVSRVQREHMLQAAWRGRPYQSLVDTFGSPRMIMSVPGYRAVRTEIVVYGTRDRFTNCIDAFTIVTDRNSGAVTVADYFCR